VPAPSCLPLQLLHERLRDQQLELELARRQAEVAGRLEHINSLGEAQAGAEAAERARLERKRQQLEAAHRAELQQVGRWASGPLCAVCWVPVQRSGRSRAGGLCEAWEAVPCKLPAQSSLHASSLLQVRAASPPASQPAQGASADTCGAAPAVPPPPQVHARHAELMGRLQEERERRLLELEALWRARVQQEVLLKLQQAQVGWGAGAGAGAGGGGQGRRGREAGAGGAGAGAKGRGGGSSAAVGRAAKAPAPTPAAEPG
jgi:hypothetical protein